MQSFFSSSVHYFYYSWFLGKSLEKNLCSPFDCYRAEYFFFCVCVFSTERKIWLNVTRRTATKKEHTYRWWANKVHIKIEIRISTYVPSDFFFSSLLFSILFVWLFSPPLLPAHIEYLIIAFELKRNCLLHPNSLLRQDDTSKWRQRMREKKLRRNEICKQMASNGNKWHRRKRKKKHNFVKKWKFLIEIFLSEGNWNRFFFSSAKPRGIKKKKKLIEKIHLKVNQYTASNNNNNNK